MRTLALAILLAGCVAPNAIPVSVPVVATVPVLSPNSGNATSQPITQTAGGQAAAGTQSGGSSVQVGPAVYNVDGGTVIGIAWAVAAVVVVLVVSGKLDRSQLAKMVTPAAVETIAAATSAAGTAATTNTAAATAAAKE